MVQGIHNFKDFAIISSLNFLPSMHLQMIKLPCKRVSHIFEIKMKIRDFLCNILKFQNLKVHHKPNFQYFNDFRFETLS